MKMTYDEWKKEVNRILMLRFGLDTDCMPDQPWQDWHNYGISPMRAVERALNNEGY